MFKKNQFMLLALEEAKKAYNSGEIPVGAIIINSNNQVISKAFNSTIKLNDPTAHAEILAIRKAANIIDSCYLNDLTLYTTLEPCSMCMHAITLSKINKIYFAAYNDKETNNPKNLEIYGGIVESEASELLTKFFNNIRHNL